MKWFQVACDKIKGGGQYVCCLGDGHNGYCEIVEDHC